MYFLILVSLFLSFECHAKKLNIYAASSLTEVLSNIVRAYNSKRTINTNFSASSKLAYQIKHGAPADIYMSANQEWMDFLIAEDHIDKHSVANLLKNRLVLIAPLNSTIKTFQLSDLKTKEIKRIAFAGEAVPAGIFTKEALSQSGFKLSEIKNKVVRSDNVKIALKWVATNQADIGSVYLTDAMSSKDVRVIHQFNEDKHSMIVYPIGILKKSQNKKAARDFINFCHSEIAQTIFKKYGFIPL